MIGCLTGFVSRLVFLYFWIWTSLVTRAFDGVWIIPLLGVLFLPCMSLVYVLAYAPGIGVTGWGWFWVVVAFLVDITAHGSGARRVARRRNRSARVSA
jgi:hypothetical protein